ncbi:hypothetical protein [Bordetella genomosp. 4]|uniref:Uncharacterized protein n=1 Tax=Bordetella genomosp. 4 TaxID=463044 RepID=A0A261U0L0_9BORD|nr:hypothetical protein [Bordetella genomosp. 4]OZI54403.1 hypothetical protein CAL20_18150 [Bordetella genomosp. 4]
MSTPVLAYAFSLVTLCFIVCTICGILLFFVQTDRINATLKHPLLKHGSFRQFPLVIKTSIFQDYFFRLAFPGFNFGLFAHANKQLSHVEPRRVPFSVKIPIVGFWASCWVGLVAMIAVWVILFLYR